MVLQLSPPSSNPPRASTSGDDCPSPEGHADGAACDRSGTLGFRLER